MQEIRRNQIANQRRHYQKIEKRLNFITDILIVTAFLAIIVVTFI